MYTSNYLFTWQMCTSILYIIFLLWLIMYLYIWYFQLGDVELLFLWHIEVCDLFSEARRSGSPVEAYAHKIHGTGIFSVTKYLHLLDCCGIWLIFYGMWLIFMVFDWFCMVNVGWLLPYMDPMGSVAAYEHVTNPSWHVDCVWLWIARQNCTP